VLPHIELRTIDSQVKNFQDYDGKTILVVNVASHCGFTPQYKDLQALYTEFKDKGVAVLGFPCNQFGAQEPGTAAEIVNFCQTRYAVDFDLFEKTDVNGANTHPLFVYLKEKAPGILGTEAIKWNFTKFLIDKSGQQITRFGSNDSIEKIRSHLLRML
jgi:glutathione peroxidase